MCSKLFLQTCNGKYVTAKLSNQQINYLMKHTYSTFASLKLIAAERLHGMLSGLTRPCHYMLTQPGETLTKDLGIKKIWYIEKKV